MAACAAGLFWAATLVRSTVALYSVVATPLMVAGPTVVMPEVDTDWRYERSWVDSCEELLNCARLCPNLASVTVFSLIEIQVLPAGS